MMNDQLWAFGLTLHVIAQKFIVYANILIPVHSFLWSEHVMHKNTPMHTLTLD